MEGFVYCGTKDCDACKSIQRKDYMFSKKASVDRLSRLVDKRMSRTLTPPVITEAFDWEYQEWIDNELSLKGEPA